MAAFTTHPTGTFDLAAAAGFGFGPTERSARVPAVPRMALAFCCDDLRTLAGVELTQDPDGAVHGVVHGDADPAAVQRQVERVLSLDHDGVAWAAVGERDPVIGRLQGEQPGLRPVLFHSPYEAAAWAILSARRPAPAAARARDELAARLGATFTLHGEARHAFPAPERLLGLEGDDTRTARLRELARAALDGALDQAELIALDPADAARRVMRLPGIGSFFAQLVVVRALGHADVLPGDEPRTLAAAGHFYGLGGPATPQQLAELAQAWRPYRTWGSVLLHAAGRRAGLRPARR